MGEMTPSQQAAAFHGLAINRSVPPDERLALALQALGLYETELNRWRPVVETARALQEAWVDESGGTASDRFVAVEQAAEALTAALDKVPPSPEVTVYVAAGQVTPAERRGYEQAITHLRDRAEHLQATGSVVSALHFRQVADYLSARLTEETEVTTQ